jgi:predicted ArsR family transcriptional regulator
MLLPVFRDLVKPQWRAVLEELKRTGSSPVADLALKIGCSYMAAKNHCDELTKAGYLVRTRVPRAEVGRPGIFYSLATKADLLFPQAGLAFTLELLEEIRHMYGESAPEKVLFQYFQNQQERLAKLLEKFPTPVEKALKLAAHRTKEGFASELLSPPGEPVLLVERHNPLQPIHQQYPRAIAMETRMLEQTLGTRLIRHEIPTGRQSSPHVVFEFT